MKGREAKGFTRDGDSARCFNYGEADDNRGPSLAIGVSVIAPQRSPQSTAAAARGAAEDAHSVGQHTSVAIAVI